MKKILLFGSTGFIGSNLSDILRENRFILHTPSSLECDLSKESDVVSVISKVKPEIIINCAFIGVSTKIPFSTDYIFQNLLIVSNILEGAKGVSRIEKIIHFGSAVEYGDSKLPITEDTSIAPKNLYGTAKASSTLLALELFREYKLPLIILRPFYLYGPHDTKSVISYLISSLTKNKKFSLTKGEQIRDYLYIEDLAKVVLRICQNPQKLLNGEIYNLGSGKGQALSDVFETVFKIINKKPEFNIREYSNQEYYSQIANIDKLTKTIGDFDKTHLGVGMKKTIKWHKDNA